MADSSRPARNGLLISGCLFTMAIVFFCLWLLIQMSSHTVTDKDFEPKPVPGVAKPYRQSEFVANVGGLEGANKVYFSSKTDRVFFEGFSMHLYGSLSHPREGWVVLVPGEKLWLRMSPQAERDLWKAPKDSPRFRMLHDYALNARSFPGFVELMTRRPDPPGRGAEGPRLEMRDRYCAEVLHSETSFRGSMQDGFRKHTRGGHSEYCPELGVVLLLQGMQEGQWRSGFSLSGIEEKPIPDDRFQVPSGYREI